MRIIILLLFLIYCASCIGYLIMLFKEREDFHDSIWKQIAFIFFFFLAFTPVLNTVFAIQSYRDYKRNN